MDKKKPKTGYQHVNDEFGKFLLMADPYVLKTIMAIVVSHDLPCDPLWLFLVAKTSTGKTELINTLLKIDKVTPLSSLTSKTLISGASTGSSTEASLLLQLGSPIFVFEDYTIIMSMDKTQQGEILGQFRTMYNGAMQNSYGTGNTVQWKGKVTFIAGATHAIHDLREQHGHLGERYILYELIIPPEFKVTKRSMRNEESGLKNKMRAHLKEVMYDWRKSINIPDKLPKTTSEFQDELIYLSMLTARARASVRRDWHSPNKDITHPPEPEMPTRFASQLQGTAQSLLIINQAEGG